MTGWFVFRARRHKCDLVQQRYNKMSREIRDLSNKIKELDPKDPFRTEATQTLLDKL
jgi:hypothetical protein